MMGTKIRNFSPLPDLSLEELVPKDNFYGVAVPFREDCTIRTLTGFAGP